MAADQAQPWTVLGLLNWTQGHLSRASVDSPRLAAEVLLAHALRCRRIELYTRFDYTPAPAELDAFRDLVKRAARQEPIAYLVGEKEFYSMRFKVTPDVLVPRPETELLVAEAVSHLRGLARSTTAWDVCTGSGCVAAAVAANVPEAHVLATDVSPAAVAVAEENVESHGLGGRVRCRVADLLSLPADCAEWARCDAITANPPYVPEGEELAEQVRREPPIALYAGKAGLECIRRIVAGAPRLLRPGGALILEFGCGQADAVRDLIVAAGQFAEPRVPRDHQNIERAAVAARK